MDLCQTQIWTEEQRQTIEKHAREAAKKECAFLEVGSWCGDSTQILAKVAKENNGKGK